MAHAICERCMLVKRYPLKHETLLIYLACFITRAFHTNMYSRAIVSRLLENHVVWNEKYVLVLHLVTVILHGRFYVTRIQILLGAICMYSLMFAAGQRLTIFSHTPHRLPLLTKHIYFQELGEHGKGKDFISLGLQNGHLVFRWLSPVVLLTSEGVWYIYFQLMLLL